MFSLSVVQLSIAQKYSSKTLSVRLERLLTCANKAQRNLTCILTTLKKC